MHMLHRRSLTYQLGLLLLSLGLVLQLTGSLRAGSYSYDWTPVRYVGVRLIGTDWNVSRELCIGVSEWRVSGTVNGKSFTETWDGHGTVAGTPSRLMTNGEYHGYVDTGTIANPTYRLFFQTNAEFRHTYRLRADNSVRYGFSGNAGSCDPGNAWNNTSEFGGGFGKGGRRVATYGFEAWSGSPDRPWQYDSLAVWPNAWRVTGTYTD